MWLLAVGCGMVVGKTIIHGMVLSRFLRLKMFRADQVFTYISLHVTIVNHIEMDIFWMHYQKLYLCGIFIFQGSWMVQFFTVVVSLYLFSHAYNVLLVLTFPAGGAKQYTITSKMGITSSNLMKVSYNE